VVYPHGAVRRVHPAATVEPMLAFGHPPATAPAPTRPGSAGVATATLRDADLAAAGGPVQLSHHLLILVTAGHGDLDVDFAPRACRPGTLLWARPGQVVRLAPSASLDAMLITWEAALHPGDELAEAPSEDPFGPTAWQLAGEDEDAIITEVSQLVVDCERFTDGPPAIALLRHELTVLLLRVGLLATRERPRLSRAEARTFARFQQELEARHAITRRVEEYAAALDCSVRTLTRASLAATGRSAKQLVDDRVALSAKRMLACTTLPVAEIGRQLGFPEPTNFGRFFQRAAGVSPGAFRTAAEGTLSPRVPTPRRSFE
jgi:AraC-like DNA-binding protein